jgi:hypothetical protein
MKYSPFIIAFILSLPIAVVSQNTCDYFDYPNSTNIPAWTEQVGDWQIIDSSLHAPGTTVYNYITLGGSTQTDGCITLKANYETAAQVKFVGIVCRYTDANTRILFKIQDNGTSGYFDRCFIDNNGSNLVYFDGNFGLKPVIQLEYSGTTVTARVDVEDDGVWDYTQTAIVSNVNNGLCGIAGYAQVSADDFCYGASCCDFPAAAGSIIGSSNVCQGHSSVAFQTGTILNATAYIWEYSGTGVTVNGNSEIVTLDFAANATDGNLTVYGQNSCGNGAVSASFPVVVSPLPDAAAAIIGTDSVCAGETSIYYSVSSIGNAQSYIWNYTGTNVTINGILADVTLDFAPDATGGILTVQGDNICGTGTVSPNFEIEVLDCANIPDFNTSDMKIIPNPNDGSFFLEFEDQISSEIDLKIINIAGQVVFSLSGINPTLVNHMPFMLNDLPSGLYSMILIHSNGNIQKQFIIEK